MPLSSSSVLQSRVLTAHGIRHGFFTRTGGVSAPPWDSLSFSTTTGDDPTAVEENFARAAGWLDVESGRIYLLRQVHGCAARVLRGDESALEVSRVEGDILASRHPGLACGVRTADCAPVLLVDRRSRYVAAVHAGWRGVVRGVVPAAVQLLRELARAPLELLAAVGPHIERCCFEVGDDVAAELARASSAGAGAVDRRSTRPRVDLRQIIEAQLRAAGGSELGVDQVRGCTVCDAARFHSYRRDGQRGGRMLAAVVPPRSPS